MTLVEIVREVETLTVAERQALLHLLTETLAQEQARDADLLDFRGVGARLRDVDAQAYVDQLRAEWDERP